MWNCHQWNPYEKALSTQISEKPQLSVTKKIQITRITCKKQILRNKFQMSIFVGTLYKPHSTNIFLVNRSELLIIKRRKSLFIRCVCFVLFRTYSLLSFFFLEKFIHSLIYPFNTMDRWMHIYYVLGTVTSTKQNRTNICSHGAYILTE